MSQARQWILIGCIIGGLGLGAWALMQFAPPPEGADLGQRIPAYRTLALTRGDSVEIREHYAGQVTLVNVWATWCIPCRAEMPGMQRTYDRLKDRGFRIAAVSVDEGDADRVLAFAEELGLTFDLLQDRSMQIQQTYQMLGVPQSFLLDRRGVIRFIALGEEPWNSPEHVARIEALLAE
jgi:cytochrome c biogenesis protein CcmG/thiol:disulfide interchange protein DsbE